MTVDRLNRRQMACQLSTVPGIPIPFVFRTALAGKVLQHSADLALVGPKSGREG